MISTGDLKPGVTLVMDGVLYAVVESQHVKPGKGGAFVRTKMRKLKEGTVIERTFRVGEKFQDAFIERRKLQYTYRAGDTFHFMDMTSFEETSFDKSALGDGAGFLKENMEIEGQFYDGKMIGLELPTFVDIKIELTEPGIRGDTSKAGMKPATLETGATINVPLFVDTGDMIRVDTRTGSYISRA